jgi:RNA polymerase-binding transcription factor DksA
MDGIYRDLRKLLLARREEILSRVHSLAKQWRELPRRVIEPEEEAQLIKSSDMIDLLDERGKEEIDDIDLALARLVRGGYGRCELCSRTIDSDRLKALPAARLCVSCAEEHELRRRTLSPASAVLEEEAVAPEHRGIPDDQLLESAAARLGEDDRLDIGGLRIHVHNGVIYLDGSLSSGEQHDIVLKILTDVMGFESVVDRLEVQEPVRHGKTTSTESLAGDLARDEERLTVDVREAEKEGLPIAPAEGPLPDPQKKGGR